MKPKRKNGTATLSHVPPFAEKGRS